MARIFDSVNTIKIYEIDNKPLTRDEPSSEMRISNHCSKSDAVVIEVNDKKYTVLARALQRSVENSQNSHL
jgi:ribosomal protein L25 (general stress protein Ctc)